MTVLAEAAALTRAFAGDLSIRADGSGRTIAGIVVPYDTVARVSDGGRPYDEMFRYGSMAKTIAERGDRVKLLLQHDRNNPIGRATLLREDPAGLYGEFAVSNIPAGDQAIELVRDGVLDSFSIGFAPVKSVKDERGVTVRTEVAMREASLVTFPAYDEARIQALRAALAQIEGAQDFDATAEQPASGTDEPAAGHSARSSINWQAIRLAIRQRGIVA